MAIPTTYIGGKNGAGVHQAIINQIPPIDVYVETFLGSGAIMRRLKPAPHTTLGIDADIDVITQWEEGGAGNITMHGDAISFLERDHDYWQGLRVFVYHDPPYLREVRSTQQRYYKHEFDTPEQHARLLELIKATPPNWMHAISGYNSQQYNETLKGWRRIEFQTRVHRRNAIECVWMNYPEPKELHDYRYLGIGFRERERIKKKKNRWVRMLNEMPIAEAHAVMAAIDEWKGAANP